MSTSAEKQKIELAIKKSIETAELTCSVPTVFYYSLPLQGTSLTVHHLLMVLSGVFGMICVLIAAYLLIGHLIYYTRPKEQRQLLRIIFFLPFLTVTSFLSVTFNGDAGWIVPIGDYYESYAIAALYLFFCERMIAPEGPPIDVTFPIVNHTIITAEGGDVTKDKGPGWLKRSWFFVLQISVSRIITLIANEVLFSVTCPLAKSRSNGAIVIQFIQGTFTFMAVAGVIGLWRE